MTIEQKLKYLGDYMDMWIGLRIARELKWVYTWRMINELNMIPMFGSEITIPTFEYYLNWIERNEL